MLGKYLVLVALFLTVLFLQNATGHDGASIGAAIARVLEVDPDSEPAFETTSDITDWLNATVETIFTTPTCGDSRAGLGDEAEAPPLSLPPRCGDFICSSPEEYPSYDPGGDARQDFSPCEPDCGSLNATLVSMRVTFSDIVKLRAAYSDFDVLSEQGYAGHTVDEWGVSDNSPIGGWNICSRDKTEYGEPDLERAPGGRRAERPLSLPLQVRLPRARVPLRRRRLHRRAAVPHGRARREFGQVRRLEGVCPSPSLRLSRARIQVLASLRSPTSTPPVSRTRSALLRPVQPAEAHDQGHRQRDGRSGERQAGRELL